MTAEAATERDAPRAPGRILALDGVRGIAILLVMTDHLWFGLGNTSSLTIDYAAFKVATAGWIGVDLFFVLSGFLITGILLDARGSGRYFRSFYARRFLRIFPAYYVLLFLLVAVLPLVPSFNDGSLSALRDYQAWYWTYLQNVADSTHGLTDIGNSWAGHLWSLAVEEQFYLVWPAIVLLAGKRGTIAVCAACIVGAPLLRWALIDAESVRFGNILGAHTLMPARADSLAAGALVAALVRTPDAANALRHCAPPVLAAAALVIAALAVHDAGLNAFGRDVQLIALSALALGFAAFVALVVTAQASWIATTCSHPLLRFFGRYSYAIYLFHFPIALQLGEAAQNHGLVRTVAGSQLPAHAAFAFIAGTLSIGAAILSWHVVEQPFLRLKTRFPYAGPVPPVPIATEAAHA